MPKKEGRMGEAGGQARPAQAKGRGDGDGLAGRLATDCTAGRGLAGRLATD